MNFKLSSTSSFSFSKINKLAIPAIISGIAEPLLSITDTAIVGNLKINPTESLAAVGIAGSFITTIIWILSQSRSAISAIISQYFGANRIKEISNLPSQIILINLIISAFIYFITIFFIVEIFELYNAKGLVLDNSVAYYKIRALGLPLTLFTFSIFGVFRGMQNTFWPMIISIIGALLNVGLDFALIFGIEGFIPELQIEGAAWASVMSQAVMAILALVLMLKKTPFTLKISFPFHTEIKRLLSLSLNLIIRTIALNIALFLANSYATKYGINYIAAQTIAFQIWLFFAFFIDGYSSVGNIMSGKLLGERDHKSIWNLSKILGKYTIIVSIILGGICFLFYTPIGELFSKDNEVLVLFSGIFWIVIIMQPVNAIAFVFDGIFKGMAEAVILRNTLLFATFIGFVPTLLIGDYFNLKLYAIWMAFTVWMILRGGILIFVFRKKFYK